MKKLDVRLLRLIKDSKGQFISIAIMIVLALTIYVSFSMVADNLNSSIFHYYDITNFGDIFVEVSRIPKTAIEELYTIEGVEIAQGRISADVPLRVEDPDEKVRVRVVSLSQEDYIINDLYVIDGSELKDDPKEAVVLKQFSDARGIGLEDEIRPYIGGREYSLDVIGMVGSPEYIYLMESEQDLLTNPEKFGVIYITEEFAQYALGYKGSYNEVVIKIEDEHIDRINSIVDEIEERLDKYGVRRIIKREDQISHNIMIQEVEQLEKMATSITLLFLAVAGVIINIILSRIVKNDRMSIGIMKALGYGNFSILSHYAKFSILIGLVGSTIGIILSIPLSGVFTSLFIQYFNVPMFKMEVYYIYFVYGILLTIIFCVLSGLIGARNVIKILPADSMRPEAPKAGGRIWLERVKSIWDRISFSWKMVIRNILRSKRRAAFLILGIALTYGITIVPVFMSSVWDNLFNLQYGEFQRMDYSIDFTMPMNNHVIRELSQIVDVEHIEPKVEIPFELRRGWKKKAVSVIGIPRDTKLYNFKNLSGREIQLPDDGILLSEILANNLGVSVGDEIIIKNFMPDKEDESIEVKGIIEQYLGSNAYMDIDRINNILGEKQMVTGAILKSKDDVTRKLQNIKNIRQIQSAQDMKDSILEYMDMIIFSVGIMMIFGGILGFAIVYNVTIISISERSMEFSSLRVMGFDKKEIYKLISRENGIMTLLGIVLGIPIGYGMCVGIVSSLSADLYSIPLIVKPSIYIITGIATIIFVTIAQFVTARKIYNLNFLEALKNRIS